MIAVWLTTQRTTISGQDHQYIGAFPVIPSKICGYRQGEPSPYLVSRVLLEELNFRGLVTLAANDQGTSTPVHWSYPPCHPVAIPLAGTVGSPDSLPEGQPFTGPYGGKTKAASSGVQGLLLDGSHLR